MQLRRNGVHKGGFAHGGLPRKAADVILYFSLKRLHALSRLCGKGKQSVTALTILVKYGGFCLLILLVAFVENNYGNNSGDLTLNQQLVGK